MIDLGGDLSGPKEALPPRLPPGVFARFASPTPAPPADSWVPRCSPSPCGRERSPGAPLTTKHVLPLPSSVHALLTRFQLGNGPAPPRAPPTALAVLYTNDPGSVSGWLASHLPPRGTPLLLGLDAEWVPSRGGPESPASVVQLATSTHVLVYHAAHDATRSLPPALCALFADPAVVFAGTGVGQDVSRLEGAAWGGTPPHTRARALDLTPLAKRCGCASGGLQSLATELLLLPQWKSRRVTMSNWDVWPLSHAQLSYAALDAWGSWAVASALIAGAAMRDARVGGALLDREHGYLFQYDSRLGLPGVVAAGGPGVRAWWWQQVQRE